MSGNEKKDECKVCGRAPNEHKYHIIVLTYDELKRQVNTRTLLADSWDVLDGFIYLYDQGITSAINLSIVNEFFVEKNGDGENISKFGEDDR